MTIPDPIIPKEHGAWAVLFVPMLVAGSITGKFSIDLLLLAFSSLGVFMSYVPVHVILRNTFVGKQSAEKLYQAWFWAVVYLLVGAAFLVPLLSQGFWLLLAIGGVGMVSFLINFFLSRRNPKSIPGDLLAVFGLSLGAPSAYYVAAGTLDRTAFSLWLLNFLFFGCSVFYVHMKIRAASEKKAEWALVDKLSLGKLNLLYHVAVVAIVAVLAVQQFTVALALLAFVPMFLHAIYGTYKLSSRVRFKNLGFVLLGQSIVFGVVLWMVMQ